MFTAKNAVSILQTINNQNKPYDLNIKFVLIIISNNEHEIPHTRLLYLQKNTKVRY